MNLKRTYSERYSRKQEETRRLFSSLIRRRAAGRTSRILRTVKSLLSKSNDQARRRASISNDVLLNYLSRESRVSLRTVWKQL